MNKPTEFQIRVLEALGEYWDCDVEEALHRLITKCGEQDKFCIEHYNDGLVKIIPNIDNSRYVYNWGWHNKKES